MDKEYSIEIDGKPVTFEFKDSLIHAEGNHAGDIDAIITTKPPLPQNLLLDELHIKVPGINEFLYIYGYGVVENSLKATFNSSKLVDKKNLPEKVEVYWGPNGEQLIGEMNCMPYSKKIEHDLDDEVLEQENRRLRELLGSTMNFKEKVMIAELLAVELEQFRNMIEINKGSRDGVYDGQPVVDAHGIIGQVVHVGPFSSNVLLITDPSHAVPVQVNRNGLRAVAVGTGRNNSLLLEHLPTNSDIQVGDLIVSSGLGRRFPRGYPVGTVSSIKLEPGAPFGTIHVRPSAMLAQNREVLLVWPQELENNAIANRNQVVDNESE